MPSEACHACGLDLRGMTTDAVRTHMIACTGVDPDDVTDRIDTDSLPKVERADSATSRKDRRG